MSNTPIADELRVKLEADPKDLGAVVEAIAAVELAEVKRQKDAKKRAQLYSI